MEEEEIVALDVVVACTYSLGMQSKSKLYWFQSLNVTLKEILWTSYN
jgi:hypothetical protein